MPSLFSRSRTTSTAKNDLLAPSAHNFDEFGRVSSKLSARSVTPTPPLSKKDKKRLKEQEKLAAKGYGGTVKDPRRVLEEEQQQPQLPDGAFYPLDLEPPRIQGISQSTDDYFQEYDYGYLSYQRHVVLGLEQVARLVIVVSDELTTRGGITTPFIFSTTALDVSSAAIKRLIQTFLSTCSTTGGGHGAAEAESKWRDEVRFAGPHELGMCLRWGLARALRSVRGQEVRGLVSWEHYVEFRDSEAAYGYPPTHFQTFLPPLDPALQTILVTLLTLLSRLTANSTSSGHTPPTLSPLFGPLIFGLGPSTLGFHNTYIHYLRSVQATEHILLAFIRWQDAPAYSQGPAVGGSGSAAALGVPTRLKEWIKGYPSTLPFLREPANQRPQARSGVRTVRVMNVRRNVRMYSPDLVKTGASWAHRTRLPNGALADNGLALSKQWGRIAPASLKLPPRYSETYKKRMDLSTNFHPETGPGTASQPPSVSNTPSMASSYTSYSSSVTSENDTDYFGLGLGGKKEGEDRFKSLTDLKWGEFESGGFGGQLDKKLQFDLTESARQQRSQKRETLSWNDFSVAGFTRTDGSLSATLQFSSPVSKSIASFPTNNVEMTRKLKKTEKSLPPFGWDTEPVIGNEEVIEESFIDVFCDLVYGGGWMDSERAEQVDRDCNWALVEFKSLPPQRSTITGGTDPRTDNTLVLFEEFVPLEYRQKLSAGVSSSRRRLPSLFTQTSKSRQWKPAPTLNGRPYVVGQVPRSPGFREAEFEGLLAGETTKAISLQPHVKSHLPPRAISAISTDPRPQVLRESAPPMPPLPVNDLTRVDTPTGTPIPRPRTTESQNDPNKSFNTPSKRASFLGIPVPSPGGPPRRGLTPSEYSSVDFETRLAMARDSDEDLLYDDSLPEHVRRRKRDDAWVDILVGTQERRMGGQDATFGGGQGMNRKSDPDMASMEVEKVLAGVRDRAFSLQSQDPVPSPHRGAYTPQEHPDPPYDEDVEEIERVPRAHKIQTSEDSTADFIPDTSYANHSYSSSDHHEEPEEPEEEENPAMSALQAQLAAARQRRKGYFDMHPDRRPSPSPALQVEEDPRDGLAYDRDEEEEDDAPEPIPAPAPSAVRRLPLPPDPRPTPPAEPAKLQAFPTDARPVTPQRTNSQDSQTTTPQSKTAALRAMYEERERVASNPKAAASVPVPPMVPIAPLQPSRIPVRAGQSPEKAPSPHPPPIETEVPPEPAEPSPEEPLDPPSISYSETGRASPGRYIHGAPLHNVLEEEEEEDG